MISKELWARLMPILDELEDTPEEQRGIAAARLAGEDEELRSELDRFISYQDREDTFDDWFDWSQDLLRFIPGLIHNYRIVGILGSGGMGVVFKAIREDDESQKPVALKVLKPVAGQAAPARSHFSAEQRILRQITNPHIAALFDWGETGNGELFLALELVEGDDILTYCSTEQLSLKERLELMLAVCRAVAVPHQEGIAHRDLKPDNILITKSGIPKLVDFGVAKLIQPEDEGVDSGRISLPVLTPAYASPEQLHGNEPVRLRSDVYSLGVVLYELLTGQLPRKPQSAGDEPILRPSVAIARDQKENASQAPRYLSQGIPRDLENIVLKALSWDPRRRYPTAEGLADDLKRYLKGQPVLAHGDSMIYRSRKYVRRNWAWIASALAIIVLTAIYLADRFQKQEQIRQERDKYQAVSELLVDSFSSASPYRSYGETVTAREILDNGARRINSTLVGAPRAKMQLAAVMAEAYRNLKLIPEARRVVGDVRQSPLKTEAPAAFLPAYRQLGLAEMELGSYPAARAILGEALTMAQELGDLQLKHELTLDLADLFFYQGRVKDMELKAREVLRSTDAEDELKARSLVLLGVAEKQQGNFTNAVRHFEEAERLTKRLKGPTHPELLLIRQEQASAFYESGDLEQSEQILRAALDKQREVFGDDHPIVGDTLRQFAVLFRELGEYQQAREFCEEALQIHEERFGRVHRSVAVDLGTMAQIVPFLGEYELASRLGLEALEIMEDTEGKMHPWYATALIDQGGLQSDLGDQDRAESLLSEAIEILEEQGGYAVIAKLAAMDRLAKSLARQRRFDEARDLLHDVLREQRELWNGETVDIATTLGNLGELHLREEDYEKAEEYTREACEMYRQTMSPDYSERAACLYNLSVILRGSGRAEAAEAPARQALEIDLLRFGEDNVNVALDRLQLGAALVALERYHEALPLLEKALKVISSAFGEGHTRTAGAKSVLGACLTGLARYDDAEPLLVEGYELLLEKSGPDDRNTRLAAVSLREYYEAIGDLEEAAKYEPEKIGR